MLTLWNGFDRTMNDELRRMGTLFHQRPRRTADAAARPAVNVIESDSALVVSAEVPGFAPERVNVTVHDGVLTIEGSVDTESNEEGERVVYRERHHASFKRTFTLNADVRTDDVTAVVKDGLLTVTLPKSEAATPRKIEVQAAS